MAWPVVISTVDAQPIVGLTTDCGLYDFIVQYPYAIRERARAAGRGRWFPAVARVFYQGTITAFADNGDGTCTATVADTFCTDGVAPDPFFTPCVDTADSSVPGSFDAAIDDDDATIAVGNLGVTGHGAHTVTFNLRATNLVTAKQWANVSDAVGKLLVVTRAGEPWWNHSDRFIPWPNAPTYFAGTVLSNAATTLRVDNTSFAAGEWNAYEIMVMDTGGVLHRLTITDTSTDTTGTTPVGVLTFATIGSATLTAQAFAIIKAGGRFMPGRPKPYPWEWYTGQLDDALASHGADDTIQPVAIVPTTLTAPYDHDESGLSDCVTTVSADILLDSDPKTPTQAKCVAPDHFENPTVTRTFRYFQAYLDSPDVGLCHAYLPQATPQGSSKTFAFEAFAPATFFAAFGCDSSSATIASGSATINVSTWEPRNAYAVSWAVKENDGGVTSAGSATITSAGSWVISGFPSGDNGKTVIVSPGWPRFFERMIGRAYAARVWEPDEDPDNPGTYFTTPQEPRAGETAGPGRWVDRPAYTHYAANGDNGLRGEASDDTYLFANGDLARYVADNFWDSTTGFAADDPRAAFYDRGYEGLRSSANQGKRTGALSGTVDAANVTTRRLIDTTKDWYNFDFYGNAVVKTFSGSDSISGTSVTLASQSASAFFAAGSTWFKLQVIEGQTGTDSGGNPIYDAHLITAQSADVLTLSTAMPSVSNWRIRAAAPASSLAGGRKVKLTALDSSGAAIGSPQTVTLDGNGQHELFFPTITLPAGVVRWQYEIQELKPGAVYERTSGDWALKTSGTDTVRRGVTTPVDFIKNPYGNLPDTLKDYGRVRPKDLIIPSALEPLFSAINVLKYTRVVGAWTAKPSGPSSTPINNSLTWGSGSGFWGDDVDASDPTAVKACDTGDPVIPFGSGTSNMEAFAEANSTATSVDGASPRASATLEIGQGTSTATASAVASYLYVSGMPDFPGMSAAVSVWIWTSLDGSSTCSYIGACHTADDGFDLPDTFTTTISGIACLDWSNQGSIGLSGGAGTSGLIGDLTHAPWPAFVLCPNPRGDPGCPTSNPKDGGGSGGWETDAHAEVATWTFTYA